ncbi:MAG: hypothetical protein UX12_C0011G0004 [Candidatus Collierbacteria bacterium GW2011_GWC1_45_47]|uniref:Peptidase M20 dimerisation domain-containing protein n=3 Tax=Candidatus Collieribacteriota TaxID=1752725 RepID=A0A0G1JRR6_9BACT|nr:MAG: hypothetical protein UW23_C0017G0006 [Candidatus Collierbacteria bacterium GW2011_GWA1_44_12]KKT46592.1 MAG: hypothetical protein UW35_C0011G0003 [Candidatus Collierbacteria bacterium GW2011_GWF2_44_15]KKT67982.1 MAG: hypothetical protein UW62_C0008G0003 [Candidatus Collierbacteria bacterium GW2011_GWB1_44_35]KKU09462.1 MAG: hypothetical protein UX12_C0011G0004 [Candidatus Collierbacteria bacterium GW2011_GWC1_45_47]
MADDGGGGYFNDNKQMTKKDLIEQLDKLVGFKTLPGELEENSKALDYVESLIVDGIVVDRIKNGKAEILRAQVFAGLSPQYCYMVHMDVVAGTEDQFKMKVEGDKVWGRGTCDMKFSIPVGIALLNEAVKNDIDFCLMITTDEEVGGFEGAKYAVDQGFSPRVLIVPDGGENLNFVDKAKGVCQVRLAATGIPAHSSRPWLGKNALDSLVLLAEKLLKIYGKNNRIESWETTMNIGTINGGTSTNQVCPEAEMKIDFRYPETDSIENILGVIRESVEKLQLDIDISTLSTGLPTFTDVSDPEVKKFIDHTEKAFGEKIIIKQTYGASDARHFAHLKCPVMMQKPMGGEIHSSDEWMDLTSTMQFYQGMRGYLGLKD